MSASSTFVKFNLLKLIRYSDKQRLHVSLCCSCDQRQQALIFAGLGMSPSRSPESDLISAGQLRISDDARVHVRYLFPSTIALAKAAE